MAMFLVGDIGGTKVRLGICAASEPSEPPTIRRIETYSSTDADCLASLISPYLSRNTLPVTGAVLAVAGPVSQGQSRITNLPWMLSEDQLQADLNIPSVRLINDLEAVAYAVPYLRSDDTHVLNPGVPVPGGTIGVIAPGTGLGESFLTTGSSGYQAHASEGGHTDFAPTREIEIELLHFLMKDHDHVSVERVCSGMALRDIYRFFRDHEGMAESPGVIDALTGASDPAAVIVQGAMGTEQPCDLCRVALEMFVSVLGAEAGNLALTTLATGGIYLGGGIPPRILPILDDGRFMETFRSKGRMSGLLSRIPVHVILDAQAALQGAAHVAGRLVGNV